MKYVIRWKSKVNGRAGRGTKEFSREDAERLVRELNAEYPDIEHEPIPTPPPQPQATEDQPQPEQAEDRPQRRPAEEHTGERAASPAPPSKPVHALS